MKKEEIQAKVSQLQWFHNYELVPGVMTNGFKPVREEELAPLFQIPQDLRGKRVLDVGCADGYYTFLAESRGASVVAIDAKPYQGFSLAHEVHGSKAEFHQMDIYDLQLDTFGMFDVVFFMGVYYHLKNPILALERIATVTRELAIIESHITNLPGFEEEAISRFYDPEELMPGDPSNRWVPNVPCLLQTVRAAGFPRVEFIGRYADNNRGVVHAYKGPRTAAKMLTEDFVCTIHAPSTKAEVTGNTQVSGVAFSKLERAEGIERITVYLDKLDDPAFELGEAKYPIKEGSWQESIAAQLAGGHYGAVGFEFSWDTANVAPGQHTLYILAEGQHGWHYAAKPIIVNGSSSGKFATGISWKKTKMESNKIIGTDTALSRQIITQRELAETIENLAESINVSQSTQSGWPLVDNIRRAFHNLVLYYVNLLANKQKRVNQAMTAVVKWIVASQEQIEPQVEALQQEVAALRAEIQALQVKLDR